MACFGWKNEKYFFLLEARKGDPTDSPRFRFYPVLITEMTEDSDSQKASETQLHHIYIRNTPGLTSCEMAPRVGGLRENSSVGRYDPFSGGPGSARGK